MLLTDRLRKNYRTFFNEDAPDYYKVQSYTVNDLLNLCSYVELNCYEHLLKNRLEDINVIEDSRRGTATIVFYSGGLESTLLSLMPTTKDTLFVNVSNIQQTVFPLQIEQFLYLFARVLGGKTVLAGGEYVPETTIKTNIFKRSTEMELLNKLKVNLLQPLGWADKFILFKQAYALGLDYLSCSSGGETWCGHCFKCFQIASFYKAIRRPSPFKFEDLGLVNKYLGEIDEYKITGVDPFCDDNYSFIAMEQHTGLFLDELWENL